MRWNWQLEDWPHFHYEREKIALYESKFLMGLGGTTAYLKTVENPDYNLFLVDILLEEGTKSSRIEGEVLDRDSLQSSIQRQFGLLQRQKKVGKKEEGMAELLRDLYATFDKPLTHQMLFHWHCLLFKDEQEMETGAYRTHSDPMQIISNRYDRQRVYFEAPPSQTVYQEMEQFIAWFNAPHPSPLGRAAVAHVYFESIHPFEDGNGRIGRALIEKVLSQIAGRPVLIAVSKILEQRKKEYYSGLGKCNKTLSITPWVLFLSKAVCEAQEDAIKLLQFLIQKNKLLATLQGQINSRQEKTLLRLFEAGPAGFKGGLSAEKYIAITKTSRATATRDLAELVDLGALEKTGTLRHTRYWLKIGDKE